MAAILTGSYTHAHTHRITAPSLLRAFFGYVGYTTNTEPARGTKMSSQDTRLVRILLVGDRKYTHVGREYTYVG